MERRSFLKASGLALGALGAKPAARPRRAGAWARSALPRSGALVCVHLRGGADALSLVVPYHDPAYYALRPTLAVPPPGAAGGAGALDLDGRFGLHPALAPLLPGFRAGLLAIVPAVGSPVRLEGHAEAQAFTETGVVGARPGDEGWLTRLAAGPAGRSAAPLVEPTHGGELAARLARVAERLGADPNLRFASVESSGWDTHHHQADHLPARAAELAEALARFPAQLGTRAAHTVVLVVSEFGRAAAENRRGGTEHGHGGVALVLGAPVRGGRVVGRWPGLAAPGGHLAVTLDLRALVSAVAVDHLGYPDHDTLFPGFSPHPTELPDLF
jgi:uncharacterized protein (DUF1501 family)